MLRLTIAAWVGLCFLPTFSMALDDDPVPPASDSPETVLPAPDNTKPVTGKIRPGKGQPAVEVAPLPEAVSPPSGNGAATQTQGVVVPGAKIIIRPWNYESDREWDYTLSNARPAPGGYRISYEDAYNSITFRRSQYNAQPSYRHDAAMELMFGVMRPTTIVRNSTQAIGPEAPYPYHDDFRRRRSNGFPTLNPYYVYPYYSLYTY